MSAINYISFPGLGIDYFGINPVAFSVFGREVRWYGIILCLGIIAGFLYFHYRARQIPLTTDDVLDYAIFIIPTAIIGARAYFVLTKLSDYKSFYDMIAIWNGGIAIYGAIIGGFLALALVSKFKKKKLIQVLDAICPGVMLGQIIGRWGNFVNAEAYGTIDQYDFFGHVVHTPNLADSFPLRMNIRSALDATYTVASHPTFLYESVWNLLGFILIHFYYKKKKFDGEILLMYLAWYGFGRCIIEGFREDSLWVGSFRISQVVAAACFVIGMVLLISTRIKIKKGLVEKEGYKDVFSFEKDAQNPIVKNNVPTEKNDTEECAPPAESKTERTEIGKDDSENGNLN